MSRQAQLDELFTLLYQAVEAGKPCPTNEELSARFGFKKPQGGMNLIRALEESGRITVERTRTSRVVTLVGTTINGQPARTVDKRRPAPFQPAASVGKPRVSAEVIRAAKLDGRDLPTFVTALIGMGLDCWRDERRMDGEAVS